MTSPISTATRYANYTSRLNASPASPTVTSDGLSYFGFTSKDELRKAMDTYFESKKDTSKNYTIYDHEFSGLANSLAKVATEKHAGKFLLSLGRITSNNFIPKDSWRSPIDKSMMRDDYVNKIWSGAYVCDGFCG